MTKRFGVPEARQDMGNSSSAAFTLAEVLITLGIIGVVAAMTIPTLISNTNGAQFKTAYKKALSVLNQAAVMNVALEDFDFSTIKEDGTGDTPAAGSMGELMVNRTMGTYNKKLYDGTGVVPFVFAEDSILKGGSGEETKALTASDIHSIEFPDGTAFSYSTSIKDCKQTEGENKSDCIGFIDANGKKGPNEEIKCSNDGKKSINTDCFVDNGKITDIYPVYIYGQQIVPASDAARAVLFGNDKAKTTE